MATLTGIPTPTAWERLTADYRHARGAQDRQDARGALIAHAWRQAANEVDPEMRRFWASQAIAYGG